MFRFPSENGELASILGGITATRYTDLLAERLDAPVVTTPSGRGSISEEHRLGRIKVGYCADLTAFAEDPATCPPEDLVGAVSFLASDDAEFMTGQTMVVDGGSAMI